MSASAGGIPCSPPLYVALEVLLEVLIPLVMADLIDRGIEAGDMGHILRTGAVLVVMALFSLTFGVLSGRYAARASAGLAKNLRRDIYHNVQNAYQMLIRVAVRCPLMLVFAFTMTVRINPRIALIYLCVIPVLAVGLVLIITRVHALFTRVFRTYDQLNGVVQENLRWGNEQATDEELVRACRRAQADGFIREFPDGYDTYIEQGGSNVSGGQNRPPAAHRPPRIRRAVPRPGRYGLPLCGGHPVLPAL